MKWTVVLNGQDHDPFTDWGAAHAFLEHGLREDMRERLLAEDFKVAVTLAALVWQAGHLSEGDKWEGEYSEIVGVYALKQEA